MKEIKVRIEKRLYELAKKYKVDIAKAILKTIERLSRKKLDNS